MTESTRAPWRQAALCFLTFLIGIAGTLIWQRTQGGTLSAPVLPTPLPSITVEPFALPSIVVAGFVALLLVGISVAAFKAISRSGMTLDGLTTGGRRIYQNNDESRDVDHARTQVERQLADLVGYVSRYLDATRDAASDFENVQARLANAGTVEQVREIVRQLINTNSRSRRHADELNARLVEARSESVQLQQNLRKAEALAAIDGLTSLPNRRHFQERLEGEVEACHRDGTPLCLLLADIDYFKAINDKFGHLSGDAVLKAFAQLLANGVRSTDVAARYGGEEFGVILPRTPLGSAAVVAESLRRAVAERTWTGSNPKQNIGRLTASFGVAEIREAETIDQLIDRADQKLYEAKQKGRNRVAVDHTDAALSTPEAAGPGASQ